MDLKQKILEAVLLAMDEHDAEMTDSLLHSIVDHVAEAMTPTLVK
jgi:hypothetical protein